MKDDASVSKSAHWRCLCHGSRRSVLQAWLSWLTCRGTAWLKPHCWLNNLCPRGMRGLWRAGVPWGCGSPHPHASSRPRCHSDFSGSCAEVLCGHRLTLERGADSPYPTFMWLRVLLPKTCSDTWWNSFPTQGIPRGNSRSMGSVQPVDKASSISIFQVDDSGRASAGLSQVLFTWRNSSRCPQKQPPRLRLISFFSHSVSFYPFITSAPLDYLPVTLPAPRSLSQTF